MTDAVMTETASDAPEMASNEVGEVETQTGGTPAPSKRYKVKVDDTEEEVDEAELLSGYQKSKASAKRFEEAAQLRKEIEEFVGQIKQDPKALLKRLGHNVDSPDELIQALYGKSAKDYAEELLMRELEESLLSPEEKELRSLRADKEARQREEESRAEQQKQARVEAMRVQAAEEIQSEVIQAIQESGMQATPRLVYQIASQLLEELDNAEEGDNFVKPDARKALGKAKARSRNEMMELLESVQDDDALLEMLPKSLIERVRKAELKKMGRIKTVDTRATQGNSAPKPNKKRLMSIDDLLS